MTQLAKTFNFTISCCDPCRFSVVFTTCACSSCVTNWWQNARRSGRLPFIDCVESANFVFVFRLTKMRTNAGDATFRHHVLCTGRIAQPIWIFHRRWCGKIAAATPLVPPNLDDTLPNDIMFADTTVWLMCVGPFSLLSQRWNVILSYFAVAVCVRWCSHSQSARVSAMSNLGTHYALGKCLNRFVIYGFRVDGIMGIWSKHNKNPKTAATFSHLKSSAVISVVTPSQFNRRSRSFCRQISANVLFNCANAKIAIPISDNNR